MVLPHAQNCRIDNAVTRFKKFRPESRNHVYGRRLLDGISNFDFLKLYNNVYIRDIFLSRELRDARNEFSCVEDWIPVLVNTTADIVAHLRFSDLKIPRPRASRNSCRCGWDSKKKKKFSRRPEGHEQIKAREIRIFKFLLLIRYCLESK